MSAADPALARRRAAAQLLHRPTSARDPAEIARAIAGVQAQDRYAARLSFRSRSRVLTAADIDRARTEERSLIRTWVMRMTIHLIPTDDARWMLPLFEPVVEKWSRRRLGQLGMPPGTQEKALRAVARTLAAEGPMTRAQLRDGLEAAGIELDQQTGLHIVLLATVGGIAIQGPDIGASPSLVRREDWLGPRPSFDREKALAELARRYLGGFGPATDRDFAKWSGLPLGELRKGLAAIGSALTETRRGDEVLLSLNAARARLPRAGQLRLLGAFDTYLLGYASRDFAVSPERGNPINTRGGGMIEPAIVRDGEIVGTWGMRRRDGAIEATLQPFTAFGATEREAIEAEIADIARFEGTTAKLTSGAAG